jgi:hypothetical protein
MVFHIAYQTEGTGPLDIPARSSRPKGEGQGPETLSAPTGHLSASSPSEALQIRWESFDLAVKSAALIESPHNVGQGIAVTRGRLGAGTL